MKQPEDTKTLELTIDAKRGRGRPAKSDALSQAERAKRYRAKRKTEGVKSDVTEKKIFPEGSDGAHTITSLIHQVEKLRSTNNRMKFEFSEFTKIEQENERLKRQVKMAEDERNAAFKAHAELEKKIKSDATEKNLPSYGMLESKNVLLNSENMRLGQDHQHDLDTIAALKLALAHCLHARSQKKRISDKSAEAYSKLTK
ncbi:MAG: hypothetical protein Q8R69_18780 [Telluria sp.]|nr:hypothetical protein [Telluria sp.]